jgi:NitT/TauT family transport system substrate-binding protein
MFKQGGLQPKIREAQFGTLLPALKAGAGDIALELEPNVSIAASQGGKVVYSLAKTYGDFAITGVTVSDKTISSNPTLVRRFVRALNDAESYGYSHPDDVEAFAVKRFSDIDPTVVKTAIKRMIDEGIFPRSAEISQSAWRNALQLRAQAGDIQNVDQAMKYLDNPILH